MWWPHFIGLSSYNEAQYYMNSLCKIWIWKVDYSCRTNVSEQNVQFPVQIFTCSIKVLSVLWKLVTLSIPDVHDIWLMVCSSQSTHAPTTVNVMRKRTCVVCVLGLPVWLVFAWHCWPSSGRPVMHPHVSPTMASQAPWLMQSLYDQAKLCSHLHSYPVMFDEHTKGRDHNIIQKYICSWAEHNGQNKMKACSCYLLWC